MLHCRTIILEMDFWLRIFLFSLGLSVIFASSSNISPKVMNQLDDLYDKPTQKLKDFPKIKMILLLSGNDEYRLALENTSTSKRQFTEMLYYIIDKEMAKSAWTFWGTVDRSIYMIPALYGIYSIYEKGDLSRFGNFLKKLVVKDE